MPKLAASSAGRSANGRRRPTACNRPRKRPIHSSTSGSSSSGARPPRRAKTAKRNPSNACSVRSRSRSGGTAVTSASASSAANACSSRICASLQRLRPVELRDDESRPAVVLIDTDLEHAVFVAVQRQQRPGGDESGRVDGVQDHIGRQSGERRYIGCGDFFHGHIVGQGPAGAHGNFVARGKVQEPRCPPRSTCDAY